MKDLATNPRLTRQRPLQRLARPEPLAKGHRAPILPDPLMGAVSSPHWSEKLAAVQYGIAFIICAWLTWRAW